MKKLKKIAINPEKVISNEELMILKGLGGYNCYCNGIYLGEGESPEDCDAKCAACTECW